jgi:copper resistance protein B
MKTFVASLLASLAAGTMLSAPASAQHAGHDTSQPQPGAGLVTGQDAADRCAQEAQRHRDMGHAVADGACEPTASDQPAMDHGTMDHSQMNHGAMAEGEERSGMEMPMAQSGQESMEMDHSQMNHGDMPQGQASQGEMDHSQMDHSQMGQLSAPSPAMLGMDHSAMQGSADDMIPLLPPPPEAGSGPARAGIAIWGEEAMNEARQELVRETDGGMRLWIQGDRVEYRAREGADGYLWDVQGYYGGDINKFWFKSEGEGSFGEPIEGAEVQALWSRAIAPFFDFQAGVRQDLTGPERTHAVIGIQGIAPYKFEMDAAAFISNKGDVTARIEGEIDQRITQRLILQPRAELALSAQDIPELGVGAGIDRIEAGLRLRYEFVREFAPYIGVAQEWRIGGSADFARAAGEDPSVTNYVVGVRFWF